MDSEWIEHHGKGYPDLPMDTLVQVRFADQAGPRTQRVDESDLCWRHSDPLHPCDITHYRLVAPLGPVRAIRHGAYIDQLGRDYNSIEHVLRCAIAEALGGVRA